MVVRDLCDRWQGGAKHGKHTNCRAAALADSMMNQPLAGLKGVLELCFNALQVQRQAQEKYVRDCWRGEEMWL